MICEQCKKEIEEGNFLYVPVHKATPQGIVAVNIHIVVCDDCKNSLQHKAVGFAKVREAEIVTEGT